MWIVRQQSSTISQWPKTLVQWLWQQNITGRFQISIKISDLLLTCLPNFYPRLYFDKPMLGAYWTISLFNVKSHEKTTQFTCIKAWKKSTFAKFNSSRNSNHQAWCIWGVQYTQGVLNAPLPSKLTSKVFWLSRYLVLIASLAYLSISPFKRSGVHLIWGHINFETRKFSTCQLYFINCDCHRTKLLYSMCHSTCERRAFTEH